MYHEGNRFFQDRFDTRRLADRLEERLVLCAIDDEDKAFIESRDMFFLATVDDEGQPNCSYKGGDPGFVSVVDERTIAFPNYDGNGMYLSIGNVWRNHAIGMLFIDWERPQRLRVNGDAQVSFDDPLLARYHEAQFMVRVAVREVFPNCGRYIHRLKLIERSRFVPRAATPTPIPDWKRDMDRSVLSADDPLRREAP